MSNVSRSGYDNVLLFQFLVPRLVELKQRPKICKKGNRVTSIAAKNGVEFRDIARLLAPSTSLRKFGQLFDLEQAKAHFPFAYLTSVARLQDSQLPGDFALWRSELTGERQSDDQIAATIAEAIQLWNESGCTTVGDYLASYLHLDIVILHEGAKRWISTLEDLLGLNFIEAGKFTISSLSYAAGLRSSEARIRPGSFFPNNSQLYSVLRLGMRGYILRLLNIHILFTKRYSTPPLELRPKFSFYPANFSGLCSVFRSRAGDSEVLDKVLCRGPHHADDDDPADDPTRNDEQAAAAAGLVSSRLQDHHHNAHWLTPSLQRNEDDSEEDDDDDEGRQQRGDAGGGGPSRYVAYYDAASLYPSSGEPDTCSS